MQLYMLKILCQQLRLRSSIPEPNAILQHLPHP
jgi:hypothetical protein